MHVTLTHPTPTGHPVLNETCPRLPMLTPTSSPNHVPTSTIIAAVVGGLLGLLLVLLIVTLVIYYQVCRKADPVEENSRESAFDFSNKTAISAGTGKSGVSGKPETSKVMKNSKANASEGDVEKGTAEEKEVTPPKEKDETTL